MSSHVIFDMALVLTPVLNCFHDTYCNFSPIILWATPSILFPFLLRYIIHHCYVNHFFDRTLLTRCSSHHDSVSLLYSELLKTYRLISLQVELLPGISSWRAEIFSKWNLDAPFIDLFSINKLHAFSTLVSFTMHLV